MKRILFSLMALAAVLTVAGTGAFAYFSDTETSTGNTFTAGTWGSISATIDFDPDTLNLKAKGNWVTVYIELPDGYDVRDIVNTEESPVMLNGDVPAVTNPDYGFVNSEESYIMDHDEDGILERMVKFNQAAVQEILSVGDEVVITITGKVFYNGDLADFEGSDVIRVIDKGKDNPGKGKGN